MMLAIIERYLARELVKSSIATTLILFVIFMSNTLGRVLSDVSEGKVPLEAVLPVMAGQSFKILTLLLPLGFFLGVIFAFGKLYKDHEMIVLQACGYSYTSLYRVVMWVLMPLFGVTALCSLWLSSDMLRYAHDSIEEKKNTNEIQRLKPGQFNQNRKGDRVFFPKTINEQRTQINDIIIAGIGEEDGLVQTARRGRHDIKEDTGDLFLEMGPGTRYEGRPGRRDYHIIEYQTHGVLLEKKENSPNALKSEEKYLSEIIDSGDIRDRTELVWRINIPLTLVVLGLLAVPLSYISPRQGRYGKVGIALLVFILYLNLLGVSKSGLESGKIPMWLNFWWVHLIFVVVTLLLIARRTGWTLRRRQRA